MRFDEKESYKIMFWSLLSFIVGVFTGGIMLWMLIKGTMALSGGG